MNRPRRIARRWQEDGGRAAHERFVAERRTRRLARRVQSSKANLQEARAARLVTLRGMTRKELLEIAKETDLRGRSRMTKDQLVKALT